MTDKFSPDSFTPNEARKLLGTSTKSLIRWADKGIIRTSRTIGGHRRFWKEDVLRIRRTRIKLGLIKPDSGVKDKNSRTEH